MSETNSNGLCGNCVSACCRGKARLTLALSKEEADNLRTAGTELKEFLPAGEGVDWKDKSYLKQNIGNKAKFIKQRARDLAPGYGLFGLVSDCGFLVENDAGKSMCSVHENPDLKPQVCDSFNPGSNTCLFVRKSVVLQMRMEDSIEADLVDVSLGRAALRTFSPAFE